MDLPWRCTSCFRTVSIGCASVCTNRPYADVRRSWLYSGEQDVDERYGEHCAKASPSWGRAPLLSKRMVFGHRVERSKTWRGQDSRLFGSVFLLLYKIYIELNLIRSKVHFAKTEGNDESHS